jgi:hypothetical protein
MRIVSPILKSATSPLMKLKAPYIGKVHLTAQASPIVQEAQEKHLGAKLMEKSNHLLSSTQTTDPPTQSATSGAFIRYTTTLVDHGRIILTYIKKVEIA